ncbi:MAG TPA: HD domain-containing protein [Bacteroidales bacterium]|nr:HD domain-containing protein [Bacteroidales bacterium]
MTQPTRENAIELMRLHIRNEKMQAHCLASEAVMRKLAKRLAQDAERWGLAGLLHDLDAEITEGKPEMHGHETVRILRNYGIDNEILDVILMHNEMASGSDRTTMFQHALAAGETITGLIAATALVYPDKKVASVKPKSVVKRMKEKAFAASVNREHILECEKLGLDINEFATLALEAMTEISDDIGL